MPDGASPESRAGGGTKSGAVVGIAFCLNDSDLEPFCGGWARGLVVGGWLK